MWENREFLECPMADENVHTRMPGWRGHYGYQRYGVQNCLGCNGRIVFKKMISTSSGQWPIYIPAQLIIFEVPTVL